MSGFWNWFVANVSAFIAALGFVVGVAQYIVNSRREKAARALGELQSFLSDPEVQAALKALDYADPRTLAVLEVRDVPGGGFTTPALSAQQEQLRDKFDVFLTRLEMIEGMIDHRIISKEAFGEQFSYWLELLGEVPDRKRDTLTHLGDDLRQMFWRYVRAYRFRKVVALFARYDRASAVDLPPDKAFVARAAPA